MQTCDPNNIAPTMADINRRRRNEKRKKSDTPRHANTAQLSFHCIIKSEKYDNVRNNAQTRKKTPTTRNHIEKEEFGHEEGKIATTPLETNEARKRNDKHPINITR